MKNLILLVTLIIIAIFWSCNPQQLHLVKFQGETQGTYYAITYYDKEGYNFKEDIEKLLHNFDTIASMWVDNSLISQINRNEITTVDEPVFTDLFNQSKEISRESGGAFDPTVGPLVNAWGFGFTDRMQIDSSMVDSLVQLVGFDRVQLTNGKIYKDDPRMQLDFNAIAQGFSVDLIAGYLENEGISNYLIDVGGEVMGHGTKPNGDEWKVGIEKPADHAAYGESLNAVVKLFNKALATSGNYRKFYVENGVRYSHTIDPKTGYPVQHPLLSVSVMANNCALADGWATAFMVLGLDKSKEILQKRNDLEAYFIYSGPEDREMKVYYTPGIKEILVENN